MTSAHNIIVLNREKYLFKHCTRILNSLDKGLQKYVKEINIYLIENFQDSTRADVFKKVCQNGCCSFYKTIVFHIAQPKEEAAFIYLHIFGSTV